MTTPLPAVSRALLGTSVTGTVVLATNCPLIAHDCGEISEDAVDIGLCSDKDCPTPGLYLFEGETVPTFSSYECFAPDGFDWRGTVRPVRPDEIAELYAMQPPPEPDDDGETPTL